MEQFLNRKILQATHYATPIIEYPTVEEMHEFTITSHVWTQGDRFYKLSDYYYGDARVWWVIPWFNKRILESDYLLGDSILIPKPLELALTYFGL
tara:strand:- start:23 stop:307 length:285 start_codon:yes stop_codon:yes gene_type:complete